jgi:hypothetical protein
VATNLQVELLCILGLQQHFRLKSLVVFAGDESDPRIRRQTLE